MSSSYSTVLILLLDLDASICEKDCQSYKKNSAFSKQCDKEGGFFKCCIRFKNFKITLCKKKIYDARLKFVCFLLLSNKRLHKTESNVKKI